MRRLILAVGAFTPLLGLACSGVDAPSPPAAAAVVGPDTLTVERLSNWLVLGQPLPITAEVATGLAEHWLEMAAVARAEPARLRSPRVAEQVRWPELRAVDLNRFLARAVPSVQPSPATVESAFAGDRWRMAAHILRRASREAHPEERDRQREAARRIRDAITRGTPWDVAVRESEDEETRTRNGLLGLVERGDLSPALAGSVFSLRPGEVSSVVESDAGFHVVYRPRLEDVRPLFREALATRLSDEAWDEHLSEQVQAANLRLSDDGAERLRSTALGLRGADSGDGERPPLATWRTGALSDSVARRYLGTLDAADRRGLRQAPDEDWALLLRDIARQEVVWDLVEGEEEPMPSGLREEVLAGHDSTVTALFDALGAADGSRDAAAVHAYLERVVSRRQDPVSMPAPLRALLLRGSGEDEGVDTAGVRAAVDRAARLLRSAGEPGG